MSVTFHGKTSDGKTVVLEVEDPASMNLSCANARAFLLFLGLEPGEEPSGEATLPQVRSAIIRAGATFDRRVGGYTRVPSDTKRPGCVRVIDGGLDEGYFEMRLHDFEKFLGVVAGRGATSICWG